jgi:hypothetical protein
MNENYKDYDILLEEIKSKNNNKEEIEKFLTNYYKTSFNNLN